MDKKDELRSAAKEDLCLKLEALRQELFRLRSERLDSKTQKVHLIRQKRKAIARILTIQRERELVGAP